MNQDEKMFYISEHAQIKSILRDDHLSECPNCQSKRYHLNDKHYLCQDCNVCGDSVAYLMEKRSMGFDEAVNYIYNILIYGNNRSEVTA